MDRDYVIPDLFIEPIQINELVLDGTTITVF